MLIVCGSVAGNINPFHFRVFVRCINFYVFYYKFMQLV